MKNIEPAPKGEMSFNVTFEVNADGLLTVTAEDCKTKQLKEIKIQKKTLPPEKVQQMIEEAERNK